MAKKTTVTRAAASDATLSGTEATQQGDASAISTVDASNSSGDDKPDEDNSQNTPQSSGDAAGEAPADLVKPQVNFAPTEVILAEAKNQTPAPVVEASTSGNNSEASQGAAEGAGANAGSSAPEMTLADILVSTGTASFEQLCSFVKFGRDLIEQIQDVSADYPSLQLWIGSEKPADIVRELAEENAVLQDIRKEQRTDSADGKRIFAVLREVSLDNELFSEGGLVSITKKQHEGLAAANACDPDWEAGV